MSFARHIQKEWIFCWQTIELFQVLTVNYETLRASRSLLCRFSVLTCPERYVVELWVNSRVLTLIIDIVIADYYHQHRWRVENKLIRCVIFLTHAVGFISMSSCSTSLLSNIFVVCFLGRRHGGTSPRVHQLPFRGGECPAVLANKGLLPGMP